MGKDLAEIIGIFLLSALKFGLAGVPAAVIAKFSFFKSMVVTISGGLFGVVFFTYFNSWLNERIDRAAAKRKREKQLNKKKFTLTNKLIVYVKRYFGLPGLAAITPLFLSIPLGVFLATRYYKDKQKVISYMTVSVFCWAVGLYFLYKSFSNLL